MSLSSLIVEREVATIREVEEALARQVLYGGDLVTNLLEVSAVGEGVLLDILAEHHHLVAAPPGELPRATEEAKRLVAPEVAVERNLAPLSVDRDGLVIAIAEPLGHEAEQELAFALAVAIVPRIASQVRIRQALARDFGVPLERRQQRLLARLAETDRKATSLPPLRAIADMRSAPRPPTLTPPILPRTVSLTPRAMNILPGTFVRHTEVPAPRPLRRRRGPLTAEVAQTELEESTERDTIFDLVFEYARQFFDYTASFIVHGDIAEGRDASGEGASRERIVRLAVPLGAAGGLLASARSRRTLVRGIPAGEADAILIADLGRTGQTECVSVPIVVRGRVVALIFGDSGDAGIDRAALAEVERLVVHAVAAFERLIVRRKLQGSLVPPPTSSVPLRVDEPAAEELAAPVREILNQSLAPPMSREPSPIAIVTEAPKALSFAPGPEDRPHSERPPPQNLLEVRRPSGPPIPREEPDSRRKLATAVAFDASAPPPVGSLAPPSIRRRAEAPAFEFGTPSRASTSMAPSERTSIVPATTRTFTVDDLPPMARRSPKAESPPSMPAVKLDTAITDLDPTPIAPPVSPWDPEETPIAPPAASSLPPPDRPSKPMPASEQRISVPPHKPPSARSPVAAILPSVIVDVATEYVALVAAVIAGPADDAEAELLRAGGPAMPAIMAEFPGPLAVDPSAFGPGPLPRVSECGPILRLIAAQRRTALPFVLAYIGDTDAERRFWATYLLSELVYPDALEVLVDRLFDEVPRVRRAARTAARAFAEVQGPTLVARLEAVAKDAHAPRDMRSIAIEALGDLREGDAVPPLVVLLSDGDAEIAEEAHGALVLITRQDFGNDPRTWTAWWDANKERHRLEWLIDALMHEHAHLRAAASEELKATTKEYFGYYDDLPKRERERAQARFREWWTGVGRVRFARNRG